MDRLMPFDELNIIRTIIQNIFEIDAENRRRYLDFLIDEVEDILIMSFAFGNEAANTMLDLEIKPNKDAVNKAVYRKIAGKDWKQRITEYLESETGTAEEIMRVIETDSHRIYNEAMWEVAQEAEDEGIVIYKRWETMLDDRVRDTHEYIQGEMIPLNQPFFTYDGDEALRPGDFMFPENNIGCRCRLVLIPIYPYQ